MASLKPHCLVSKADEDSVELALKVQPVSACSCTELHAVDTYIVERS